MDALESRALKQRNARGVAWGFGLRQAAWVGFGSSSQCRYRAGGLRCASLHGCGSPLVL